MKQITIIEFIIIIATIVVSIGFVNSIVEKSHNRELKKNNQPIKIEDNAYTKYEYMGHVYIHMENNCKIHDPDCPKCLKRINGDFEK